MTREGERSTDDTGIRRLIGTLDWSQTSLGALAQWPQSLKTAFGMCLASRFPFIIWWGEDLTVVYNDAYIPIFGDKHPAAFGSPGLSLRAWGEPETRAAIEPMLRGVMAGAEATWSEDQLLILERSGFTEESYFTWSYSPIPAEGGRVGGVLTTVTEVTQKVLSERRLRVLRELSAHAAEAKTAEQACREAIQVLREDPHDLPFALLYVLEDDEATLHGVAGLPADHPAAPARIVLGDGARWPLHRAQHAAVEVDLSESSLLLGAVPAAPWPEPARRAVVLPLLRAGEGRPYGFLIAGTSPRLALGPSYRDFLQLVTGHIATAIANARTSQAERRRTEKLAELDRAKTTFFSNVSHEFRTPLTLMLGPLEDVLPHIAEPHRGELERVQRNGKRLLKLVNTLLDFSRVEAGRVEAGYEPVDLALLTADLASSFRSLTERAGLVLTVECAPLPEPIWVDPEMWEKIVLNLLSNAFKFTFQGEIGVRLAWQAGAAQLRISDTGAGIPAAALPRLFERFHRVEGARGRSFEGTGIGLALVHELVKSHGGSVEAASDEGRGTTFTVTIPAGTEHLPRDRLRAARASSHGPSRSAVLEELSGWQHDHEPTTEAARGPTRSTPAAAERSASPRTRVVLADDNADMRDYVRRLLEPLYDVVAVSHGALALAAVRDQLPDLVVTDVMMPVLDGFGLLRELRADPATQTVPVLMLSARAGEEARVEGLSASADDYLVKPFSARELLARVAARLEIAQLHARLSARLEERVEQRTAQLLAANQELESFSYSVSHDLRAPLRHILGFAQLLEERLVSADLDTRGREHLRKITVAAKRGGQLVDDLLAFSRLGRAEVRKQRVSLEFLVAEARAELAPESASRPICWTVHALPEVEGDPSLLRLVLKNLVGNAIKYTRDTAQPAIEIGAAEDRGEVECWIKDNGIGFDMAYVDKLFGVFQRLHHEQDYEGTGIGLAHVRRIITRHGGRTWARGEVGRGATFSFALPSARRLDRSLALAPS